MVLPLKPEHGYLTNDVLTDWPKATNVVAHQNDHFKLYRPGIAEPVVLPMLTKEIGYASPALFFSEYTQRYVIVPSRRRSIDLNQPQRGWPRGEPNYIYLLAPDGKVDTVEVPYGNWVNPNIALPTREGLFIVSTTATSGNSKQAGGWLVRDGRMKKVFDHLPMAAGVSPDGCKIAYAANDFNPKTTEYVKIIDLCGGG